MSDSKETEVKFEPITASADGKRNRFSRRCDVLGQVMNYAACLWRLGVLSKPDIRTPADWAPCGEASRCGRCNATNMRQEEELKGYAIYFTDAAARAPLVRTSANTWGVAPPASTGAVLERPAAKALIAPSPPVVQRRAASAMDVMGSDSYAEAITAAVVVSKPALASSPAVVVSKPALVASPAVVVFAPKVPGQIKTPVSMLPGESPLAYARRLRDSQTKPA